MYLSISKDGDIGILPVTKALETILNNKAWNNITFILSLLQTRMTREWQDFITMHNIDLNSERLEKCKLHKSERVIVTGILG